MSVLVIRIEVDTDSTLEDPHDVADELIRGGMELFEVESGWGGRSPVTYAGVDTSVISAEWGE